MLENQGAKLIFFSPIKDNKLPENLDGLYFGGGYPELFAKQLAENTNLRSEVLKKSMEGMPIYGECGGFMYLCSAIRGTDGIVYPMTGCFPFITIMFTRLKALGYREITLTKDTLMGKCGQTVKGHEFHYSEISGTQEDSNVKTVYKLSARTGIKKASEGYRIFNTLGSYIHLHFGSQPECAINFADNCLAYRDKRILTDETE